MTQEGLSVHANYSLAAKNCLAVPASCKYYQCIETLSQLTPAIEFSKQKQLPVLIFSGGSNIVLSQNFSGIALEIALKGRKVFSRTDELITVELAAGENWHETVCWALDQGFYGLENLALIPGSVGAAPIQNIGAYGVELDSYIDAVQVFSIDESQFLWMSKSDCEFGYRDSIFKNRLKDRVVVTAVRLSLRSSFTPNVEYQALRDCLDDHSDGSAVDLTPQRIFQAVCNIRSTKLPDPATIPNVGSFFKNPVVSKAHYNVLLQDFSNLVVYPQSSGDVKLAAAQLIDLCGWKGFEEDGVGVHSQQALVLVNPGRSSGREVLILADKIRTSVEQKFGILLDHEPRIY